MRVATYNQPPELTRGSLLALAILVMTILLGTGVIAQVTEQFLPFAVRYVTFAWLGLYLLAFGGLMFTRGINWLSWLARYRILLLIVLIGSIASVGWSIEARLSAERTVHLIGTSMIGIYLGFTVPLMTMLRVLGVVLGGIVLLSFPAALLVPELGLTDYEGSRVWRGLTNSKNDLGFWAASGVLLYVTLSDSTSSFGARLLCYLFAGLCLVLLAFSQSATSLLAMVLAGALSLYLFIAGRFQLGFVRMAVVAVLLATLVSLIAVNIDTAELVGRSDDLTGRGEVWRQTWNLIMERPLSGYGYGALWFPNDDTIWIQQSLTDFTWVVYHAHNGFLQVASEIGLPLSILALLMVVQQLVEIFYCQYQRQQPGVLFVLAFIVAYLVTNFSEARFLVTRELYWMLFIALPISMLRQINVIASELSEGAPGAPAAGEPFIPGQPAAPAGGEAGELAGAGRLPDIPDKVSMTTAGYRAAEPLGAGPVGRAIQGRWEDTALIDPTSGRARLHGPVDIDLGEPSPVPTDDIGFDDDVGALAADRFDKPLDANDRSFDMDDDGTYDWAMPSFDDAGRSGR